MTRLAIAIAFAAALLAGAPAADDAGPAKVSFGAQAGDVIELKDSLGPYHAPSGIASDNSAWYVFSAINLSDRPATRVLLAGQPPDAGLTFFPSSPRPTILEVASTAQGMVVESSNAYGRKGFRVTVPAGVAAPIAVRVIGAQSPPSLLAWTEPALAAHNRQIAIFVAAVAGLIGAAAAIAGGLALITHHAAPRWAAVTLLLMLLMRLAAIGLFDGSLVTSIGGPYGLTAMLGSMTLVAGMRFVDLVVPLRDAWPKAEPWLERFSIAIVALAALAYVGLPGATVLTDCIIFLGVFAITGYLVHQGRRGSRPARVLTPSAGLFAAAAVTVSVAASGLFGNASLTPDLAGGFAAAGAIMLALAVAAGEGVAVLPFGRHHAAAPVAAAPVAAPPPPPPSRAAAPVPNAAIEAIGASRQGVFDLDLVQDVLILSDGAGALIGIDDQRLPHSVWASRIHRDDRPVYEQALAEFRAQSGFAFRIEFRVGTSEARYAWLELRATMKGPEGAAAERCVGLLADVTMRKEADAEAIDRSLRDPLTGLGNRVALMEELEGLGNGLADVTFAVLDIDRFKTIHASLGDAGGDQILVQVADRLNQRYYGFAQVFRIGGDAFAVLLRTPNENPAEIGAALAKTCGAAHQFEGRNVFAPASVGVAAGAKARDPIDLLKNAELALIQAKRQGGDCARVYSPEMESQAPKDAVALEAELHGALEGGQIEVFYQPIVRLSDRTVAGFEALLRWRHPLKGLVEPADFIAHSEETGLIVALGRLALARAAKDLAQWQRFFPLEEPLFVSVNLSRRQLHDSELVSHLAELLSRGDLAPGSFRLEITESAIATDADARALAARIRALGAGLAIDDFGTGMSSLSQLADLPFDAVKIDKSFLARHGGTDSESDGDVVLASIVSLAHELKRSVIVEGVETEADAARMAGLGCEFAQGFLFSEPISMSDTLGYVARRFRAAPQRNSGPASLGGQA